MKKIISLVLVLLFVICCNGCGNIISVNEQQSDIMTEPLETTASVADNTFTTIPTLAETTDTIQSDAINGDKEELTIEETTTPAEPTAIIEPNDTDFVRITDYIPTAVIDLKYATEDNFTGQIIYSFDDAWLRYGTVKKLQLVADELAERGLYLKIWDSFRPISAQFTLWNVYPDATFVANPNTGFSSHSRGNTIDITLVDANGYELLMPTEFDDFSALANRSYNDCDPDATSNAILLENLMKKHGFEPYYNEWWHYSDTTSYEAEEMFDPAALG